MRKTILTLAMMMTMAFAAVAGPKVTVQSGNKALPTSKSQIELKGDTLVVNDGDEMVAVSGIPELQKVRDKINHVLDDTLTAGSGAAIEIGDQEGELSPDDIKEISNQWASVAKQWAISGSFCLLGLVALVLFFRFLNRRNKYRVIEKAIENNYPLNEFSLNDTKRRAIYVQQPVVTAAPPVQPGQVPVGTPISGQTPDNPIVMTDMVNWRAMMPAIRVLGWGAFLTMFGIFVAGGNDPFTVIGLALIFVGLCKGFILYKEQKALQEAWKRAEQQRATQPQQEPMREGIPVPPPIDEDYREDDNTPYQPY